MIFKFVLQIDTLRTCDIDLSWMSQSPIYIMSTLIQEMAWFHDATSHNLSQYGLISMSSCCVTWPQCINFNDLKIWPRKVHLFVRNKLINWCLMSYITSALHSTHTKMHDLMVSSQRLSNSVGYNFLKGSHWPTTTHITWDLVPEKSLTSP